MTTYLEPNWQPTASFEVLQARASMLQLIREFFANRKVLEVTTPSLGKYTVTDRYIQSISANVATNKQFLQTSPEYFMKRLLAKYSCSIYQICQAFRDDEKGAQHNPEFTILEWYRLDFDQHMLMQETAELLQLCLNCRPAIKISYQDLFLEHLNFNPHTIATKELQNIFNNYHPEITTCTNNMLNMLFSTVIEPRLQGKAPWLVYNYPASMAALARINNEAPLTAARFEVFYQGIELGNGYHEALDAKALKLRFEQDNNYRKQHNLPTIAIDPDFIAAMEHGLPNCAGIAIGLDRLLMVKLGITDISKAMSFSAYPT